MSAYIKKLDTQNFITKCLNLVLIHWHPLPKGHRSFAYSLGQLIKTCFGFAFKKKGFNLMPRLIFNFPSTSRCQQPFWRGQPCWQPQTVSHVCYSWHLASLTHCPTLFSHIDSMSMERSAYHSHWTISLRSQFLHDHGLSQLNHLILHGQNINRQIPPQELHPRAICQS